MVSVHQNLNGSNDLTTLLSGMVSLNPNQPGMVYHP